MPGVPNIQPLKWTDIRDVLPHEALDFTPWLANNLDLLARTLGLEDLELIGTESFVGSFRLDIRATGTDASGEAIAVVVENQYNRTDHDHLGKLVTYAARADAESERVLAVWVVEHPVPAHVAAIEFLNRISAEHVGWVLLSPRFAPSPEGGYYVHFEKHVEPNSFINSTKGSSTLATSPERIAFMTGLFNLVEQPLRKAGYRHVWSHPNGNMIRAYLPKHLPAATWAEIRVLVARSRFQLVLFVRGGKVAAEHNSAILEDVAQRHGALLQESVGVEWPVAWHASSANDRSDSARITWEGHGFLNTKPGNVADLVITFASACLTALKKDDITHFPELGKFDDGGPDDDLADLPTLPSQVQVHP